MNRLINILLRIGILMFLLYQVGSRIYEPAVKIADANEGDVKVSDNQEIYRKVPYSAEEIKESLKKYNTDKVIYYSSEDNLLSYAYSQFSQGKGILVAYSGVFHGKDYSSIENEDLDYLLARVVESHCHDTSIEGITLWGNIDSYNKGLVKLKNYTLICMSLNYKNGMDEMEQLHYFYEETYKRLYKKYAFDSLNDVEKVKVIHDYICENFDYDETLHNYDDFSALRNYMDKGHVMVCQGYSLMTAKLLNLAGIPTRIVLSDDYSHSWNIVKIDNLWYQLDVTHDDTGYFNHTYDYKYFLKASFVGETEYGIAPSSFLYTSLYNYDFAKEDLDTGLHNRLNINAEVYEFFYRTLYTNSKPLLILISLLLSLLMFIVLSLIKEFFHRKRVRRNRDYNLYNDM